MLYADEFHRFASPVFVDLIREVRKFGIATTVATQFYYELPSSVQTAISGVGTHVCFQLVPRDVSALKSLYPAGLLMPPMTLSALKNLLPYRDVATYLDRDLSRYKPNRQRALREAVDTYLLVCQLGGNHDKYFKQICKLAGEDALGRFPEAIASFSLRWVLDMAAIGERLRSERGVPSPLDLTATPRYQAVARYLSNEEVAYGRFATIELPKDEHPYTLSPVGISRSMKALPAVVEVDEPPPFALKR